MMISVEQLQAELDEATEQVGRLEARYGMSLADFEAAGLPGVNSQAQHEDYADWFYWASVIEEKQRLLANDAGAMIPATVFDRFRRIEGILDELDAERPPASPEEAAEAVQRGREGRIWRNPDD